MGFLDVNTLTILFIWRPVINGSNLLQDDIESILFAQALLDLRSPVNPNQLSDLEDSLESWSLCLAQLLKKSK